MPDTRTPEPLAPAGPAFIDPARFLAWLEHEERPLWSLWIPASAWQGTRRILHAEGADFASVRVGRGVMWERFVLFASRRIRSLGYARRVEAGDAVRLGKLWLHARHRSEVDASDRFRVLLADNKE